MILNHYILLWLWLVERCRNFWCIQSRLCIFEWTFTFELLPLRKLLNLDIGTINSPGDYRLYKTHFLFVFWNGIVSFEQKQIAQWTESILDLKEATRGWHIGKIKVSNFRIKVFRNERDLTNSCPSRVVKSKK